MRGVVSEVMVLLLRWLDYWIVGLEKGANEGKFDAASV